MTLRELSQSSADIGLVTGVLEGIKMSKTLLPHQEEGVDKAIESLDRLMERIKDNAAATGAFR